MIYLTLFAIFFKTGLFSFGGGLAMLPLIFESVGRFEGMSEASFADLVALSQVTPGPVAVNAATYVGMTTVGLSGALAATIGVSLPSFLLVLLVMRFLERYRQSRAVRGVMEGIRPATVALMATAAVYMARSTYPVFASVGEGLPALTGAAFWIMAAITAAAAAILTRPKVHPIWVLLASGAAGAVLLS